MQCSARRHGRYLGCGPVGQFAIRSAFLLGAERVIAIDRFPARLQMARDGGADTIDYEKTDVYDTLMQLTGGRGPDSCMDAVGLEAHMPGLLYYYDRIKQAMMSESNRPIALRQAIMACRNGGTVSIPGVYGGLIDKMPMGAMMNKALRRPSFRKTITDVFNALKPDRAGLA